MVVALLLALANPALAAFDDANQALTACSFAAHRQAAEADKSLDTFKASLATACASEIARIRRAIVAVETGRGKSQSNARLAADQTIAQFHSMFADGYARRHESEAQLKALVEASGGRQMLSEFRNFVARGNVLDLAVAVIIGAAFATIAASLTGDIIMPLVGAIFGGLDFSNHFTLLGPIPATFQGDPASYADLKKAGVAMLGWGQFVTVVINFLILAFIIFLLIRWASKMMRREEEAPAGPSEVELLAEIRDELRKRG